MDFLTALKQIILRLGYGGVFAATMLEYGCFPVSSEILLPFIGYMASQGGQSLFLTILFATGGGVLGSLGCYLVGRAGGGCWNSWQNASGRLHWELKKRRLYFENMARLQYSWHAFFLSQELTYPFRQEWQKCLCRLFVFIQHWGHSFGIQL